MTKLKSIFFAVLMLGAMPIMSGCSTLANAVHSPSAATYDEKALITAELSYSFLLGTVTDMANAGALTADQARQIQPVLVQTQAAIAKAEQAYDAGRSADAALATSDAVAQVVALTALLQTLGVIHRTGG